LIRDQRLFWAGFDVVNCGFSEGGTVSSHFRDSSVALMDGHTVK